MTLEIISDVSGKYIEIQTKNKKFADYPEANVGGFSSTIYFVETNPKNLFKDMEAIATWVNNELEDECMFAMG